MSEKKHILLFAENYALRKKLFETSRNFDNDNLEDMIIRKNLTYLECNTY